jgi:hypothetical protein
MTASLCPFLSLRLVRDVILACPESFFRRIPNKSEGFPTSGNDVKVALLMNLIENHAS